MKHLVETQLGTMDRQKSAVTPSLRHRGFPPAAALIIEPDPMRALGLRSLIWQELPVEVASVGEDLGNALTGLCKGSIVKYCILSMPKPTLTKTWEWAQLHWLFHLSAFIVLVTPANLEALLAAFASRPDVLLPYNCSLEDLRMALRGLQEGETHWDSGLLRVVSESLIHFGLEHGRRLAVAHTAAGIGPARAVQNESYLGNLTKREWDVLKGLAKGLTNRQLSVRLGIAERTVSFHITNLYSKLDARSRTELGLLGRCAMCHFARDSRHLPEVVGSTHLN
jgi:DNA-binding NarL/FixJ family response regulator